MKASLRTRLVLSLIILLAVLCLLPKRGHVLGFGHLDIPLEFVVLEETSGQPISGAMLHLQNLDYLDLPPEEPNAIVRSVGLDGRVKIILKGLPVCSVERSDNDGRFVEELSRWIRYPPWECHVNSEGYEDLKISWQDFKSKFTDDRRFLQRTTPPPIVLRLKRKVRPQTG